MKKEELLKETKEKLIERLRIVTSQATIFVIIIIVLLLTLLYETLVVMSR